MSPAEPSEVVAVPSPSYHDVVVFHNGQRYEIFDGYRYFITCNHVGGWEFWTRNEGDRELTLVGGEWHNNDFRIEVAGHVICEAKRSTPSEVQPVATTPKEQA